MNTRTKGGAKQEFKEKKLGLNQEILEYYDTKLQLYLHAFDYKKRNLENFKKNGGRKRWVTDLRESMKDGYPLMNIHEILYKLQGATLFSSLDACQAYHTVGIKPENRDCTAFISTVGTFQYIFTAECWK